MFNHQTKTITFAAFLLAFSGLLSRFLGLARDRLLASRFGAGEELDIYFAAFRIPDFIYAVLIVGAITAAFLPVFSGYFKKEGQDQKNDVWPSQAQDFTNNVLNCFLLLLILICGVLAIFAPWIIRFVIPGFSPANKALTVAVTRIMFLSPILFGVSSILSGILQYFNRFLTYALAPILYNIGIIFGILFLVPRFGIYGLAWGVILGAFLYFIIQIPAAKSSGYRYRPVFNFKQEGLARVFKLMLPRTVGTVAGQINLVVLTAIASALTAGSIAIFNFATNIQYFPIGIIGISFAVSSFPVFSRFLANGKKEEFLEHFSSSFRQILFFIIPLSFLIFILRAQIIRLILGAGQFDWQATRLTAACLGIFCLGILAESLMPLLSRVFFSFHDTKTPVAIGMVSVVLNIAFSVIFVFLLGFPNTFQHFWIYLLKIGDIKHIEVTGLPLALSLAALIQLILLLVFLYKKIGDFKTKEIWHSTKKILVASVFMTGAIYLVLHVMAQLVDMKTFFGVFLQTSLAALAGSLIYFIFVYLLKSPEMKTIISSVLGQLKKGDTPNEPRAN